AAERVAEPRPHPRDRAAPGQARGQTLAAGQEGEDRGRGDGPDRAGLHDRSDRDADPVARAVDLPEEPLLVAGELAAPGLGEADEEETGAEREPSEPSSPDGATRSRATQSGDRAPVPTRR